MMKLLSQTTNAFRLTIAVTALVFLFSGCSSKEQKQPLDKGLYAWKEKAKRFEGYTPDPQFIERTIDQTSLEDLTESQDKSIEQEKPLPTTPVSIKVSNVPAGVIIATLARKENLNILNTEKVLGNISLNLKRVPWNQIFKTILRDSRCTYEWEGEVLRIITLEDIKQESEMAELLLQKKDKEKKLTAFSPTETKIVKIQFAAIKDVQKTLEETLEQQITIKPDGTRDENHGELPGSVILDKHTNSLILRGKKKDLDLMIRLVKAIDIPTSQINIKAYIVETTQETGRDLGLQWGGRWRSQPWGNGNYSTLSSGPQSRNTLGPADANARNWAYMKDVLSRGKEFNPNLLTSENLADLAKIFPGQNMDTIAKAFTPENIAKMGPDNINNVFSKLASNSLKAAGAGTSPDNNILNSLGNALPGAAGISGLGAAGLGMGILIGNLSDNFLDVQLAALEADNKANILSNPSITTIDNVMAYTENGEKIPYITVEDGERSVNFEEAVLRLEITPHVIDSRYLKMDIKIKKDEVDMTRNVQGNPLIVKKETQTSLIVENNETIVISGLTKTAKGKNTSGVPGVKDAPLLGWLFKGQARQEAMHDVLIFITPKILPKKSNTIITKMTTLEKLEKLQPTNDLKALKWKEKSQKMLEEKTWDEVIRAASIALALDPGLEKVYCDRARAYLEKGELQNSYEDTLTALYMNDRNARAYRLQGLVFEGMGKSEKALESLEKGCGLGDEQACEEHKRLYYKGQRAQSPSVTSAAQEK